MANDGPTTITAEQAEAEKESLRRTPWYHSTIDKVLVGMGALVVALLIALCAKVFRYRSMCPSAQTQFTTTEVDIIGYKCRHRTIYGLALVFSLALQILRSCLRLKEVQYRRDAMSTPAESGLRKKYVAVIAGYTFLGYTLYIISILFLVSKNLGILIMLLVGSVVGSTIAYYLQPADRYSVNGEDDHYTSPPPIRLDIMKTI